MHVDPKTLSADESYKLMTGVVVPRPVAWVTTIAENGSVNLAPFSTFTFETVRLAGEGLSREAVGNALLTVFASGAAAALGLAIAAF